MLKPIHIWFSFFITLLTSQPVTLTFWFPFSLSILLTWYTRRTAKRWKLGVICVCYKVFLIHKARLKKSVLLDYPWKVRDETMMLLKLHDLLSTPVCHVSSTIMYSYCIECIVCYDMLLVSSPTAKRPLLHSKWTVFLKCVLNNV